MMRTVLTLAAIGLTVPTAAISAYCASPFSPPCCTVPCPVIDISRSGLVTAQSTTLSATANAKNRGAEMRRTIAFYLGSGSTASPQIATSLPPTWLPTWRGISLTSDLTAPEQLNAGLAVENRAAEDIRRPLTTGANVGTAAYPKFSALPPQVATAPNLHAANTRNATIEAITGDALGYAAATAIPSTTLRAANAKPIGRFQSDLVWTPIVLPPSAPTTPTISSPNITALQILNLWNLLSAVTNMKKTGQQMMWIGSLAATIATTQATSKNAITTSLGQFYSDPKTAMATVDRLALAADSTTWTTPNAGTVTEQTAALIADKMAKEPAFFGQATSPMNQQALADLRGNITSYLATRKYGAWLNAQAAQEAATSADLIHTAQTISAAYNGLSSDQLTALTKTLPPAQQQALFGSSTLGTSTTPASVLGNSQ